MTNSAASIDSCSPIEEQLLRHMKENRLDVPMLPEVARKVVQLSDDPDSDASAMSKLIQGDQTLAVQVMRIANSAMYSPGGGSMASLQQAITRLGIRHIGEIALAASLHARLFDAPGHEEHVLAILKRALAAGLWAKEIARSARKNVEAAFLGGLMHDIGRPVVLQSIVEIARAQDLQPSSEEIYVLEEKYQRSIGLAVVKHWGMPTIVCDVIEHVDDYHKAETNQLPVMIVVAGALFANTLMIEDESDFTDKSDFLITHEVMADLNFYRSDIEALIDKKAQVDASVETMFQ